MKTGISLCSGMYWPILKLRKLSLEEVKVT